MTSSVELPCGVSLLIEISGGMIRQLLETVIVSACVVENIKENGGWRWEARPLYEM